ncbi:MAG TPA: low affinity iron permease family protein [Ktedonobacteraceae bacterium]|jgi:low affinity Fe/Cu permease
MLYRTSPFSRFARWTALKLGNPVAFVTAALIILVWAITGPLFHFSDTWQLIINTSTTIVTFLMVFLIQNTQNRDSEAIQLKLDELIRATQGAHNGLLNIEELTDEDFNRLRARYAKLASATREELRQGLQDTGTPQV